MRSGNNTLCCGQIPIDFLAISFSLTISYPFIIALPDDGGTKPGNRRLYVCYINVDIIKEKPKSLRALVKATKRGKENGVACRI